MINSSQLDSCVVIGPSACCSIVLNYEWWAAQKENWAQKWDEMFFGHLFTVGVGWGGQEWVKEVKRSTKIGGKGGVRGMQRRQVFDSGGGVRCLRNGVGPSSHHELLSVRWRKILLITSNCRQHLVFSVIKKPLFLKADLKSFISSKELWRACLWCSKYRRGFY